MLYSNGLKRSSGAFHHLISSASSGTRRAIHNDGRYRLSNFWTPTQCRKPADSAPEDGHDLLVRAGFLRQAYSGIFHLLPLGLRVQDKIERLIDKHMQKLGASKVALSSLSSEELWQRSGRLDKGRGSEFFRLADRKGTKLLLSPTHEEEITTIAANALHSHKQLPLRLYQISRKYRDEARPRQGLLRGREFVMKDLYTFDASDESARATYEQVRQAYRDFLDELRLPYLVANADSGNMGGSLSHEYHFASNSGEDTIIKCDSCDYSINEELYIRKPDSEATHPAPLVWIEKVFVNQKRDKLIRVIYPKGHDLNPNAVKYYAPEVDVGVEDPLNTYFNAIERRSDRTSEDGNRTTSVTMTNIVDPRCAPRSGNYRDLAGMRSMIDPTESLRGMGISWKHPGGKFDKAGILLTKAREGDTCPACHAGRIRLHRAVEIGHTFHLGTRYSEPLDLKVTGPDNKPVTVSMGCHGIGVSRLVGAAATLLADAKGLNWPLAIAPFGVLLVGAGKTTDADLQRVYDQLLPLVNTGVDFAIDDREQAFGWKLNDADLIGYPFIAVLGKGWTERQAVELQCRRLGVKEEIAAEQLGGRIAELSGKL